MRVVRSGRVFECPVFKNGFYKVFLERIYSNNLTFVETIIRSEDNKINNVFHILEKSPTLKKLAILKLGEKAKRKTILKIQK